MFIPGIRRDLDPSSRLGPFDFEAFFLPTRQTSTDTGHSEQHVGSLRIVSCRKPPGIAEPWVKGAGQRAGAWINPKWCHATQATLLTFEAHQADNLMRMSGALKIKLVDFVL